MHRTLLAEAKHVVPGDWTLALEPLHRAVQLTLTRITPTDGDALVGVVLVVRASNETEAEERMRGMLAVNLVALLNTRVEQPLDVFRAGLRPCGAFCDAGLVCPVANEGRCDCIATLHLIAADLLAAVEIPSSELGPDETLPGVASASKGASS